MDSTGRTRGTIAPKSGLINKVENLHLDTRKKLIAYRENESFKRLSKETRKELSQKLRPVFDHEYFTPLQCFRKFIDVDCDRMNRPQKGVWAAYGRPYAPLGTPRLHIETSCYPTGDHKRLTKKPKMPKGDLKRDRKDEKGATMLDSKVDLSSKQKSRLSSSPDGSPIRGSPSRMSIGGRQDSFPGLTSPLYASKTEVRESLNLSPVADVRKSELELVMKEKDRIILKEMYAGRDTLNRVKCGFEYEDMTQVPDLDWEELFPTPENNALDQGALQECTTESKGPRGVRSERSAIVGGKNLFGTGTGGHRIFQTQMDDEADNSRPYMDYFGRAQTPEEPRLEKHLEKFVSRRSPTALGVITQFSPSSQFSDDPEDPDNMYGSPASPVNLNTKVAALQRQWEETYLNANAEDSCSNASDDQNGQLETVDTTSPLPTTDKNAFWSELARPEHTRHITKWRLDFMKVQADCAKRLEHRIHQRKLLRVETCNQLPSLRKVGVVAKHIENGVKKSGAIHPKTNFWRGSKDELGIDDAGTTIMMRSKFFKRLLKDLGPGPRTPNEMVLLLAVKEYMERGWAVDAKLLFTLIRQFGHTVLSDERVKQAILFLRAHVNVPCEQMAMFLKRMGLVRDQGQTFEQLAESLGIIDENAPQRPRRQKTNIMQKG